MKFISNYYLADSLWLMNRYICNTLLLNFSTGSSNFVNQRVDLLVLMKFLYYYEKFVTLSNETSDNVFYIQLKF